MQIVELKTKLQAIYPQIKGFQYDFQVKDFLSNESYLIRELALNMFRNNGNVSYKESQYPLFPMDRQASVKPVIRQLRGYGDFCFAIGEIEHYDAGQYNYWDSVVCLPRELAKLFVWKFNDFSGIEIENEKEVFEFLGINRKPLSEKRNRPEVYLENILISRLPEQAINTIPEIGWWSSDFSGYGSLIRRPFEGEITEDVIHECIRQIGYTAKDVVDFNEAKNEYMQYHYQKKFLEERILPFMSKFSYTIAEGHYKGRPTGMKRGAENQQTISPKTLQDLTLFAGLGVFVVTHKKQ